MSAIAVVVTPLEGGTPVEGIYRDKFVAHRIALTRMESLICELHLPEVNEQSEQSPVQAHSARQRMSRAGPQLGSVPSLGISALYDSVPSRVSRAELALLTLPSLDLFAAYLLCYRLSWNSPGAIRHYEGCISLHKYLSQRFNVAVESPELFKVYGGFILDEITVWLNTERSVQCQASKPIHIELPSFDNLLDHFTSFSSRHIPTIHCATLYCMDLLWLSIQCVVNRRISSVEGKDLVSEARLRAVKGQFYTHKLQHYVAEVGTSSEKALRNKTVKNFHEQLGIACCTLSVHIGIRILDDRDILGALESDEVHEYTCRLTTYLKALGRCYHRLDILCVFLAGLGLREVSSSPCK